MRDCNVITNGLEEESPDNAVKCIYKEVVVVGNGPSAITLSFLLSGHRPFYNRIPHPDPMLSARLIECTQKSLLHQDLQFLSQGMEGRSKNPISLLIDAMTHPGADMGLEWPSLLTWKKTTKSLDHIVLGKGEPGGTWPEIADHILTISPGRWMSLPGMEFEEYYNKRAPASAVAKYYMDYVKKHDLTNYMVSHSTVTMIQPLVCKSRRRARWKVWVNDANGGTISYECRHLVLATGASDKAGCLGVPGESLPFVHHDLKCFEEQLTREKEKHFYISNAVSDDLEHNSSPPFRRKSKTHLNGYSAELNLSKTNDNSSVHSLERETDLSRFRADKLEMRYGDTVSRMRVENKSDFRRNSNEFLNKQISEVKTTGNVFEEGDDVWFANDIPPGREIDLSLSDLELSDEGLIDRPNNVVGMGEEEELEEDNNKKVLIVGAGLSAADAILTAWSKNYSVLHAFRSPLTTAQLPAVMYPEYHELYKLMQGLASRKDYQALPGHQVTEVYKDNTVQLVDSSGNKKMLKVFSVAILIGSQPDLFFLPKTLKNLGIDPNKPVDCKANQVLIDPFSYRCVRAPQGLYALGPLVGDNFVRFLQGGAVAVAAHIFRDNNQHKAL